MSQHSGSSGDATGAGLDDEVEQRTLSHKPWVLPLDVARGFLIGLAQVTPSVSGGTVALVTGVYYDLVSSASHAASSVRKLLRGPDRLASAAAEVRRADWLLLLTVLIGMAAAVLTLAGPMEAFVTAEPELSRGLFFGAVIASIAVPARSLPETERPAWVDTAVVLTSAGIAFFLIGLASGSALAAEDPSLILVFLVAAVAVCALVVPGVSGSFLLLAVGLYSPTLRAIDERDLGYIAVFGAGAVVGLMSFVQALGWLLENQRRLTLMVMIGLMVGSLRALWPWQESGSGSQGASGPGGLLAPYNPVVPTILLAVAGAAVVGVMALIQARQSRKDSSGAS